MHRIQKVSKLLKFFFTFVFVFNAVLVLLYWFIGENDLVLIKDAFSVSFLPKGLPVINSLALWQKIIGLFLVCINESFMLIVYFMLIRLFGLYERLKFFEKENVRCFSIMGWSMLIGQLFYPIWEGLITLVLSINNPVGERFIAISFSHSQIYLLMGSFLLIIIAWIMDEGRKLNEDQKLTI